jgi:alpha-aminoadipate/glutamate carrier protein LysW
LFEAPVYNTAHWCIGDFSRRSEAVVHCPKCAVEIDLDEDEVEEGEIVSCPECEAELEIVQTHPVHLNVISDDEDEDEDEEPDDEDGEDDEDDMDSDSLDEDEEDDDSV